MPSGQSWIRSYQEKQIDVDASEICRDLEGCLSGTRGIRPQKKLEKEQEAAEEEAEPQKSEIQAEKKPEPEHETEAKIVANPRELNKRRNARKKKAR